MLDAPFLGDKFNYILPGLILIFAIAFVILSCLKYDSKAVTAIRSYNERSESLASDELPGETEARTHLERILHGERAILRELKQRRDSKIKKKVIVAQGGKEHRRR